MAPPLAMEPPAIERNGQSYPTPSSASAPAPPPLQTSSHEPKSTSSIAGGRKYSLQIVQQPVRARMCGFGDKDRRPITPPPCIRLLVHDANHPYNEIDINQIDTSFYVLTVDLWNGEGDKEVNLVKHSTTSPSISAATSASYPPPNVLHNPFGLPPQYMVGTAYGPSPPQQQMYAGPPIGYHTNSYQHHPSHSYHHQQQTHSYQQQQQQTNSYQQQPMYHQHQQIGPPPMHTHQHPHYTTPSGTPITPTAYYGTQMPQHPHAHGLIITPAYIPQTAIDPNASQPMPAGMFTRNLIGSLGVSAFKLTDTDNNMGVWFILQDLSVRTEGTFRLKMNFVNLGSPSSASSPSNGTAPVLASCFSDAFQVFSAKKFPGVIESTGLSKCFATQGIKIPIRKDAPRGNVRGDDDEE
ncbi:MAG: hypothetical protein Q9207_005521 [Kuettlingeria erythrocarpa]